MTTKQAIDIIYKDTPIEYIIDIRNGRDFIEVVGDAGGDLLVYRVYKDGTIVAR
jgi:hypothetical protein